MILVIDAATDEEPVRYHVELDVLTITPEPLIIPPCPFGVFPPPERDASTVNEVFDTEKSTLRTPVVVATRKLTSYIQTPMGVVHEHILEVATPNVAVEDDNVGAYRLPFCVDDEPVVIEDGI